MFSEDDLLLWCLPELFIFGVPELVRELVLLMDAFLIDSVVISIEEFPECIPERGLF